jgi:hypothetical protein
MSNELVYGDASKFVNELTAADAEAREYFDSVVTYLSACVKSVSTFREGASSAHPVPSDAWVLNIETGDGQFKLASRFATLSLVCSFPLGTIRYLLTEATGPIADFHPRRLEGFLTFTGKDTGKKTESTDKKSSAKIYAGQGTLPTGWKTDSPAGFAEPLFHQLFEPLPVEVPRANAGGKQ